MDDATVALATRIGARPLELELEEIRDVTRSMRRFRFASDQLRSFEHRAGQDLMLSIAPAPGSDTGRHRRYTIRHLEPLEGEVHLDVVMHGDGPGAKWFGAARPGDRIAAVGPRGKVAITPDVSWHLFVGDETFVAAAFAMSEAVVGPAVSLHVLCVDAPDDEVAPDDGAVSFGRATRSGVAWVHRGSDADGGTSLVVSALEALELPGGPGHVYIGGEFHMVAAARSALADRGVIDDAISAKPYWRRDLANQDHGEPERGA